MRISLALLTRNEIAGVRAIVPLIPREAVDEIFAIDKDSRDGTREFLSSQGIPVYDQETSGRGAAFKMAVAKANGDAVIVFSPDGNEDPKDIAKFRPLLEAGADMIIASRMMQGARNEEDASWFRPRKWVNLAFGHVANLFWNRNGTYVTDTINGYRLITKQAWAELGVDADDFSVEYQMTIRALKRKKKIVEFPTHEGARVGGATHATSMPTGLRFIRRVWLELW